MSVLSSSSSTLLRSATRSLARSIEPTTSRVRTLATTTVSRTPPRLPPTPRTANSSASSSRRIHMLSRSVGFMGGGVGQSNGIAGQRVRGVNRTQARSMFIQTETTPNDLSLKFIPGVPVMTSGGTFEILDTKTSLISPLAVRLMDVEGVTSIFYGPDFVTVSKDEGQPWNLVKPEIFSILMEHFTSGKPLFREGSAADDGPQDTKVLDTDSEVLAMVKELLDTRVRPAIQEDGGDIEFVGMDEISGIVKLKLKGSCRGCSSSSVTLKSGIERMLMHYVTEVTGVEQVLDEEEAIALDEFAKFEKRLEKKGEAEKAAAGKTGMEQYASY